MEFTTITSDNLEKEHLCCAISDKKHQCGVKLKKEWMKDRIAEGHIFRKLNEKGKIFIEFAPLETAWVPVEGNNYMYIYCLWVAGSFKGKGYGKELLEYCINEAKSQAKSGVCVISSKKKKPYLTDKKFMTYYNFEVVDSIGTDYELLALSFDGTKPHFTDTAKEMSIENKDLTIYYGMQCPFIFDCIEQIKKYCLNNDIPLCLVPVDSLKKSKKAPSIFNNWAVFKDGKFVTTQLLNEGGLKKILLDNK